jgi:hypothetical protein
MTIFMKNIYNIYESLLDDIDTTMKNGKTDIEKYLDTQVEKFVKIVSLSGDFNTEERIIFRDLISDIVGDKDMYCHIPKKLRDLLIVASKRKLKVKDFERFGKSEDEYNRYCNAVYNMLQSKVLINDIKQDINKTPGKIVTDPRGVRAIKLGNAIIFLYSKYIYIKIKDTHRIIVELRDLLGF